MADIKISQLGAAIAVGDTDLLPIVSGGNTLKATAAQVKEHSIGNTNISSIGDGSVTGAISALNTDKQPKTLATPLTIGGVSKTTVEAALGGLVSENQTLTNQVTTFEGNIAPVENGTNYSKPYVIGEEFIRNNLLYKVTVASVGTTDAISVGTNCTRAETVTHKDEFSSTDWAIPIRINRTGRVCCLCSRYANISTALTANTSYTIGTLPQGFRPKQTQYMGIVVVAANGNLVCYAFLQIGADGSVSITPNTSVPSGNNMFFNVTYETA